jgi:hypothetical protein
MSSRIKHYKIWCNTDNRWEDWYIPEDDPVPTTCPVDTAHPIDTAKTFGIPGFIQDFGRLTEDGAVAVKVDPGTVSTDPKFYSYELSVAAAGVTWFDLTDLVPGKRIQGIILQVKDAAKGDLLDICFCSDGTTPNPAPPPTEIPENTPLQTFGPVFAPMVKDAGGWGYRKIMFDTSKEVPATIKVRLSYDAKDANPREVLLDVLVHEE